MILAITGHRPEKLPNKETGYKLPNPTYNYVCQQLEKYFKELKPEKIISGFALGTDQYAVYVAYKLGIPVVAAIPFPNQEGKWPDKSKKIYYSLMKNVSEKVIVSSGPYSSAKMQVRNKWMVDQSDMLLAVFDGSSGGTMNCINYAKERQKPIIYINPLDALK